TRQFIILLLSIVYLMAALTTAAPLASAHAVRQAIIRSATGRPRGPRSFLRIPALRRPCILNSKASRMELLIS
ncbi:hypothetical protein PENTCL1PPCAC_30246, partial [Pristionchus entomophagus]